MVEGGEGEVGKLVREEEEEAGPGEEAGEREWNSRR